MAAAAEPAVTDPTKDQSEIPIELSDLQRNQIEATASPNAMGTRAPSGAGLGVEPSSHASSAPLAATTAQTASTDPPSLPPTQTQYPSIPSTFELRPSPPPLTREVTAPAIGPATDKPISMPKGDAVEGPSLFITLLLTTGARHPFKLDSKYLKKRNVEVENNDPVNMSLYKLKELILRDWREEWEAKPASPDSIRLISMGKLLTDKSKLSELGFKDGASPTIVHMTIKPQDIVDEEDANKAIRDREDSERSPRCRCSVM